MTTAIDVINELKAAGITSTEAIAAELTKRQIEPPHDDAEWSGADVSQLYFVEAVRALRI